MFLTTPTIEELQILDVPVLLDMLGKETSIYLKLLQEEGFSDIAMACKGTLVNIQAAIEIKINLEKKQSLKKSESKDL